MANYSEDVLKEVKTDLQRLEWPDFLGDLRRVGFERIFERQLGSEDSKHVQVIAARKDLSLLLVAESKDTPLGILLGKGTIYGSVKNPRLLPDWNMEDILRQKEIRYIALDGKPGQYHIQFDINPLQRRPGSNGRAHFRVTLISFLRRFFIFVPWGNLAQEICLDKNAETNRNVWEELKKQAPDWVIRFIKGDGNGVVIDYFSEITDGDLSVKITYHSIGFWKIETGSLFEPYSTVLSSPITTQELLKLSLWLTRSLGDDLAERLWERILSVIYEHIGRIIVEKGESPI
ncbi:MAG: hypothetical protein M1150_00300 [Patescibacteria group bacterium]|nr:hypothetical protein [Patescibacteria group bacterium]